MSNLKKYQRWMERHPRASYFIARIGLGLPMLHLYLWVSKLRENKNNRLPSKPRKPAWKSKPPYV
jgi:hypothetical protein